MTTVKEPSYRRHVGYQAGLLGGFALMAGALLMIGHVSTRAAIAQRQQEDLVASLTQVIPAALYDEPLLVNNIELALDRQAPVTVYRAVRDGRVTAVAFKRSGAGYAGDIELLISVDARGELLGVRVLSHAETPGLGDKIEADKSDWIDSFIGHSLANTSTGEWAVRKDGGVFDQFSGATITPRAVVRTVHEGLASFRDHSGELLARISTPAAKTRSD